VSKALLSLYLAIAVSSSAFGALPVGPPQHEAEQSYVICGCDRNDVSLLASLSLGAQTVKRLKCGEAVAVVGSEGDMVKLRTKGNIEGYVYHSFVCEKQAPTHDARAENPASSSPGPASPVTTPTELALSQGTLPSPLPDAPGLYYVTDQGSRALVGHAVVFHRSGSLLASTLTVGIVSRKVNIQIPGKHAEPYLGPRPVFYYRQSADEPPGVISLVLSRLKVYRDRRQLEVSAAGAGRASAGVSINSEIQIHIDRVSASVYRVTPADNLTDGEYAFYLRTNGARTQDAFVYDFSVE
jgi:hypothetical protein